MHNLDTSDPTTLETALEALPIGTVARVVTADGEAFSVERVAGGWYLPGDVVVTSGDVADGRPQRVSI